jgi:hypothetical protein
MVKGNREKDQEIIPKQTTHKTKYWATRTSPKTEGEPRSSGVVNISCLCVIEQDSIAKLPDHMDFWEFRIHTVTTLNYGNLESISE